MSENEELKLFIDEIVHRFPAVGEKMQKWLEQLERQIFRSQITTILSLEEIRLLEICTHYVYGTNRLR